MTQYDEFARLMTTKYNDALKLVPQLMEDPLQGTVELDTEKGAEYLADPRYGHAVMRELDTDDTDTDIDDIASYQRFTFFGDYYHNARWSKRNMLRMRAAVQPGGPFAKAQAAAWARKKMQVTLAAMTGTMYEGKTPTTTVALPGAQTIVHGSAGFTIGKFDDAVERLRTLGRVAPGEQIYCAWNAKAEKTFINQTQVASRDYSAKMVRDNRGRLTDYGPVHFIDVPDLYDKDGNVVERYLSLASTTRTCLMWTKQSVKRWIVDEVAGVVTWEQAKRRFVVSTDGSVGASRQDDFGVVAIEVVES